MEIQHQESKFDQFVYTKLFGEGNARREDGDSESSPSGMHLEILRLGSFKSWPRWSGMMPNRLARFGFFFTGVDDEAQCFNCGCRVKGWHEGDLPDVRHQRINPNCELLRGREGENVPLPRPSELQAPRRQTKSLLTPPAEPMVPPPAFNNSFPAQDPAPALSTLLPDYRNENLRRQTFANWPTHAYVGPDELAQAGFIYLGSQDRVQCVFCKGELRNWAPGDRAFHEHQMKFPDCPFVNNPRIGAPPERVVSRRATATSTSSSRESPALANLHALGIDTDMPKNHQMALQASRIDTYKNWPKKRIQKPVFLADAGFYFIERGDSVKCYWCDGGLKNWEEGDDPWVEHARWFPKCGHLKRYKGTAFIDHVTKQGKGPAGHSLTSHIDPREVTARMDTAIVRGALAMGFDRTLVENIIYYRLATQGDDFANSEELLDCILNYNENPPSDFPLSRPSPSEASAEASAEAPAAAAAAAAAPAEAPAADARSSSKSKKKKKKNKKSRSNTTAGTTSNNTAGNAPTADTATASSSSSSVAAASSSRTHGYRGNDSNTETPMDTQVAAGLDDDDEDDSKRGRMECRICMEKDVDVLFLPCRHLVCCQDCAPAVNKCPLCRTAIQGTINVYIP